MLSHLLTPANIKADLESTEKDEVFEEMLEMIVASQPSVDRQDALNALMQREALQTTGIIPGIAVPHAQCASMRGTALALGLSRNGVEYDSLDGSPVNFIIMMLFAQGDTESHLQTMKDVANLLQAPDFLKTIMEKKTPQEIFDAVCNFEMSLQG